MDWITLDSLKTIGGAAVAVTLVTAFLKAIVPTITGRITQLVAALIALAISAVIGSYSSPGDLLIIFFNALVLWSVAMGFDQIYGYKKPE